jgi:hypothetical protein
MCQLATPAADVAARIRFLLVVGIRVFLGIRILLGLRRRG